VGGHLVSASDSAGGFSLSFILLAVWTLQIINLSVR
jgi:hypothetical protein